MSHKDRVINTYLPENFCTKSKTEKVKSNWRTVTYVYTLRRCKTAITWLRSLSAILPLFDVMISKHKIEIMISPSFIAFAAKTLELYYDVTKYVTFSHGLWLAPMQNMQFSQYLITEFNIFSFNLTGETDFFILFISTHNKFSMSGF